MMHSLGAEYLEIPEAPCRFGGVRTFSQCPISWSYETCAAYVSGAETDPFSGGTFLEPEWFAL